MSFPSPLLEPAKRLLIVFGIDVFVTLALFFLVLPDTSKLTAGFKMTRSAANGKEFSFEVGPLNKSYVYLQDISRYVRAAVLALEDAKFYEHQGLDIEEMGHAIESSWTRGRRLRGASTITQQLAKNLYLTHERSFKRKVLEAFITLKLETTLSKNKILELYLNSIEWGRGLIGIKQAAFYYFKKRPKDLSLKESVFLAAIIPNPSRFGRLQADQTPKRFVRRQMARALQSLFDQDLITLDQYQDALMQPLEMNP